MLVMRSARHRVRHAGVPVGCHCPARDGSPAPAAPTAVRPAWVPGAAGSAPVRHLLTQPGPRTKPHQTRRFAKWVSPIARLFKPLKPLGGQ